MRIARIKTCDINNGDGLMVSIWTQGCSIRCRNCHNKETWDFKYGVEFDEDNIKLVLDLLKYPQNLAILGGEPIEESNFDMLLKLFVEVKKIYPSKLIWLWTGRKFEDINKLEILKYIDILIDGQFIAEKKDLNLKYRGSSNQRVIDVQESLKQGQTILSKYN